MKHVRAERSASSTSSDRPTSAVRADIEKVEEYIESLYEEGGEKNKGALCVLELTKNPTNLPVLIENEILIGALARVFREDWKKNFDLATNIIRIFANFSFYEQFQSTLSHHKIGVLTMQAVEYELKRCELWNQELRKADEAHAKKIKITLRKQAILLTDDQKALNLLYQLSINDDAKAMLTFTDAIQLLMRDLLSGNASDVTKAVLLNACVEKRNSQLVCGNNGQGLDLLMDAIFEGKDLLIAKIVRTIAAHDGPTQEMFLKWMDKLVGLGMKCSTESAEDQAALGLECIAAAAQIKIADWTKLDNTHHLAKWMHETLMKNSRDLNPLHLQIVIMCGTMAPQLDSAKALTRLLETFLQLLHNMQEDDEFVCQLLYLFIQLLRHKELSDILMGDNSILGAYVIDLMHDKNTAIREMCDHALTIIGEHSQEWARKIAAERFRWHNGQWLEMVEMGGASGASGMSDEQQPEDDYEADVLFDDDFNDGFEQNDNENDEVALF
ncbi:hypothetical protein WR25_20255 [Diploscapter pachys]|uniref:Kinesin-associated protein 3 n=1 Tax=Diploscapter pachys TaxID=2018661 RepID=A0A2A2LPB5_9BILA|nr:hypothetical protein WR25_20255 [Diploscapter pachys]